eukprot:g5583.t1
MLAPGLLDACAVAGGAVAGALARYQIGRVASEKLAGTPWTGWHTAGINVSGSFLLGVVLGVPVPSAPSTPPISSPPSSASAAPPSNKGSWLQSLSPPSSRTRLCVGVGFCGSFTTFSTYSVDLVNMAAGGHTGRAALYVLTNNAGGLLAALAGVQLAKKVLFRSISKLIGESYARFKPCSFKTLSYRYKTRYPSHECDHDAELHQMLKSFVIIVINVLYIRSNFCGVKL